MTTPAPQFLRVRTPSSHLPLSSNPPKQPSAQWSRPSSRFLRKRSLFFLFLLILFSALSIQMTFRMLLMDAFLTVVDNMDVKDIYDINGGEGEGEGKDDVPNCPMPMVGKLTLRKEGGLGKDQCPKGGEESRFCELIEESMIDGESVEKKKNIINYDDDQNNNNNDSNRKDDNDTLPNDQPLRSQFLLHVDSDRCSSFKFTTDTDVYSSSTRWSKALSPSSPMYSAPTFPLRPEFLLVYCLEPIANPHSRGTRSAVNLSKYLPNNPLNPNSPTNSKDLPLDREVSKQVSTKTSLRTKTRTKTAQATTTLSTTLTTTKTTTTLLKPPCQGETSSQSDPPSSKSDISPDLAPPSPPATAAAALPILNNKAANDANTNTNTNNNNSSSNNSSNNNNNKSAPASSNILPSLSFFTSIFSSSPQPKINLFYSNQKDPLLEKERIRAAKQTGLLTEGGPAPPNVVILLADSVSRDSFKRMLPNTMTALNSDTVADTHMLFDFLRFHVVGMDTRANLVPMLAGYSWEDLPDVCGEWLWGLYRKAGYLTTVVDSDCPKISGMQTLITKRDNVNRLLHEVFGHDDREFNNALKASGVWDFGQAIGRGLCSVLELFGKRQFYDGWDDTCLGSKYLFQHHTDYISEFFDNYPDVPKFAFSHTVEGHEKTGLRIGTVDKSLASFIETFAKKNPDTVVVLLSDHGLNYGTVYKTESGQLHHKLPGLFILLPKTLVQAHPHIETNMKANTRRLVTMYDLYTTFKTLPWIERRSNSAGQRPEDEPNEKADQTKQGRRSKKETQVDEGREEKRKSNQAEAVEVVVEEGQDGGEGEDGDERMVEDRRRKKELEMRNRNWRLEDHPEGLESWTYDLLQETIPSERTCTDTRVPPDLCMCVKWNGVSKDDPIVERLATSIIDNVNQRSSNSTSCQKLSFDSVVRAEEQLSSAGHLYKVGASSLPGEGFFSEEFEGVFRLVPPLSPSSSFELISIRRTSMFAKYEPCWDRDVALQWCVCSIPTKEE